MQSEGMKLEPSKFGQVFFSSFELNELSSHLRTDRKIASQIGSAKMIYQSINLILEHNVANLRKKKVPCSMKMMAPQPKLNPRY